MSLSKDETHQQKTCIATFTDEQIIFPRTAEQHPLKRKESHQQKNVSRKAYRKAVHSAPPSCSYNVKNIPDTHAALYADDLVLVWGDRQGDSMLQRTEMAMLSWLHLVSHSSDVLVVQPGEPLTNHYGSPSKPWYSPQLNTLPCLEQKPTHEEG